ncbi:MAG TPA: hypothetical protein DEO84_00125 [candidate division Zixibacteria bacterium]|jgi:hypothetical protein|nr:hypothetical protein [candidate division Zixibacteria bacterium]HBY99702.1 hypothetical protein [candidate division Zixibacteria bacterium]
MNRTGTHRVYFTKEAPLIDTVNVLGLKKICTYANGEIEDSTIAKKGVKGVYAEGWTYDPNHVTIFSDPLNVIRQKVGQCSDYANLLINLYESIGINSHGVVIFNAAQMPDSLYSLIWFNSYSLGANVLTNWLTSCDRQSNYWRFAFHAVAECGGNFCDASLGLFRPDTDYASWWKYYLYPQDTLGTCPDTLGHYLDTEPPPVQPYYYHHTLYVLPDVYPNNMAKRRWFSYHIHNY